MVLKTQHVRLSFLVGLILLWAMLGAGALAAQDEETPTSADSPTQEVQRVEICHVLPEGEQPTTRRVPESSVERHLAHGDTLGPCEDTSSGTSAD